MANAFNFIPSICTVVYGSYKSTKIYVSENKIALLSLHLSPSPKHLHLCISIHQGIH